MSLILDIETDSIQSRIWMVVTKDTVTKEVICHREASSLKPLIDQSEQVIGHNLINFDRYHLMKLWKIDIKLTKCLDTLIISRLLKPDLVNGHSLEAWALRLGTKKGDYSNWDNPDLLAMETYCRQDIEITEKLHTHLQSQLRSQKFSDYSVQLEHDIADIIGQQERNGVLIDQRALMVLKAEVADELESLTRKMVEEFEPTVVEMKTKVKTIPFNPGSRMQIVDRLQKRGWKPTEFTEKGNVILDEEILKSKVFENIPEAKTFLRYFELQKIQSFLVNWDEKIGADGRIHGRVITNGAVTGRMTHSSPNLGQVPSAQTELGKRCRALYVVPEGKKLVGIDASGLELRMLAHYMQDEAYTKAVVEGKSSDKTDVHSVNQRAAGLATRDQAKTFIYALLYGAGAEKIGSIANGSARDGTKLIAKFMDATPALAKLREKVKGIAERGSVPGLDGRRIYVRSPHKALNSLLQGAGACVMKVAQVLLASKLPEGCMFVLTVHDEWQIECPAHLAEEVGKLGRQAITDAGVVLKLRCPLDGEYKVGKNWYETH